MQKTVGRIKQRSAEQKQHLHSSLNIELHLNRGNLFSMTVGSFFSLLSNQLRINL